MRLIRNTLLMAMILAAAAPAGAQRGGWRFLGEREVSDRVDRDVIAVRGDRRFNQIRICVGRNRVRIYDLDVRFRNGGNQDVALRSIIRAGGCSRNIPLQGRAGRDITSIAFTYEAASLGRERSHLRVFGR
jgi:hypothetical protein